MVSDAALKRPAPVPEPDEVLVARAAHGDDKAFTQLYRRHARYIAGVVFRLLGDPTELDDVVQETFLACRQGLAALNEPDKLRPWLVTIAVRRVQRRLSARARRRWLGVELGLFSPRLSDPELSRQVSDLYRSLDGLSPNLRMPWVLARIEGASLEEVAAWCEVSLATTKRRLARADRYLQRKLSRG